MALSVVGAIAETVTVGAVLPFLAVAAGTEFSDRAAPILNLLKTASSSLSVNVITAAAILLVATASFAAILRLFLLWATQKFVFGVEYDLMLKLYHRIIHQRYDDFVRGNSSESVAGLEKVHIVGSAVLAPLMTAISAVCIGTFIVALLVYIDPTAAIAAATSMALIYVSLSMIVRRRMAIISRGEAADRTQRIKLVQETIGGMRDIILDHSTPFFERKIRKLQAHARSLRIESTFWQGSPRFVVEACGVALLAALAVYFSERPGGILAYLPILGALALGAQRLIPLLQQAYLGWASCAVHQQHLADVLELMRLPSRSIGRESDKLTAFQGRSDFKQIELKDVTLKYANRGHRAALLGVNVSISAGERIGVIGETGSGKSTLVDVLMGLLEPSEGVLLVDGVPITAENVLGWQEQIAHVPQSIFLTDDSIGANIAFGDEGEIDEGRLGQAILRADLAGFIELLPEGIHTKVGERGVQLSGGQRQRIGIARALYRNAKLLVLDEATSALDVRTERAVMDAIDMLDRNLTIVIIAHRFSVLERCDRIVRLQGGEVAGEGNLNEMTT